MIEQKIKLVKSGIGFDVHKFSNDNLSDNFIKIGAIEVAFNKKIIAHSDGDVVIHSLIDAMLGAMGKGDIGEYFPDNDPKWQNYDSGLMLKETNQLLKNHNYDIVNIDLIIICEEPKISPYKSKIKEKLAEILQIEINKINIKATTTEKMGFLGRKEGIACQTICNINNNSYL